MQTVEGSTRHFATLFDAATFYRSLGWPVIPLSGKLPRIAWKELQTRIPTRDELVAWFSDKLTTGVGVVTGCISRLVVIDCDSREDAAFWQAEHGTSSLIVATGGGGVHFYYALPADSALRNRQRLLGRRIDLRAEGGYVVTPPSLHPTGTRYAWHAFDASATLPAFDESWLAAIHPTQDMSRTAESTHVRRAVAYIRKIRAKSGAGGHNATFRAACKLRDAGLSPDEALTVLSEWNETHATPPWSVPELRHKIESAFRAKR